MMPEVLIFDDNRVFMAHFVFSCFSILAEESLGGNNLKGQAVEA